MPIRLHNLEDLSLIELPRHARDDGDLVIVDGAADVGFTIARLFTVKAPLSAERGKHAHKLCSQFMLCTHGAVDIVCDDGAGKKTVTLDRGHLALLVPPTIWNTVVFRKQDSVLTVLCDRSYEAEDYIRDYDEFRTFRNGVRA